MLPDEQQANSRYLYELASGKFGWSLDKVRDVQAFHFKFGHREPRPAPGDTCPATRSSGKIAEVRGLDEGTDAISPPTLPRPGDRRRLPLARRRGAGGERRHPDRGQAVGAAHRGRPRRRLRIGVDYVILDGRGGGTGAAPLVFRDNISVPTIPALARARRHLDAAGADHVTLVITGGPAQARRLRQGTGARRRRGGDQQRRNPGDRLSRHAGLPHRQLPGRHRHPEARPAIAAGGRRVGATLGPVLRVGRRADGGARACGHDRLDQFTADDLTTFDREMAHLSGIAYGGMSLT